MRPMLYVAGPYTNPDPIVNTHRAARFATAVYELGEWVPLVPHLSLLWHMVTPRDVDHWYQLDLDQLEHCNAIVRLPGASTGADRELAKAVCWGLHVVDFNDFPADVQALWLNG